MADEPTKRRPPKIIHTETCNLFFDLARQKLQVQTDQWDALDQKNAIILAIYGVTLATMASVKVAWLPAPYRVIFLSFWLLFIAMGIIISLFSIWPRKIDLSPHIENLIDDYFDMSVKDLKAKLLPLMRKAIEKNRAMLESKEALMSISFQWCVPLALAPAVVAMLARIMGGFSYGQ